MRLTNTSGFVSLLLVALALACSGDNLTDPGTGSIQIEIVTSGAVVDPDGYTLEVDAAPALAVGVTASLQSPNLTRGNHTVRLSGVAPNCTVSGDNPRTVAVAQSQTVEVRFSIECTAVSGTLEITTSTTGGDLDPDGYSVQVDQGPAQLIATNGSITVADLAPGMRLVEVFGIAPNCRIDGSSLRLVAIAAGETTRAVLSINCSPPDRSRIAFYSIREGGGADIYLMSPDGSGVVNLTKSVGEGAWMPVWSPDGSRIAYHISPDADIGMINADGTGKRNLTNTVPGGLGERTNNEEFGPAWSPDGKRIAFYGDRAALAEPANWDIYAINLDGSGLVNLSNSDGYDYEPAWSPDGRKIAYFSGCGLGVCLMNTDGTGQVSLTSTYVTASPSWSPDGRTIVFPALVDSHFEIRLINPDGTGERTIVTDGSYPFEPVWSPDGSRIAFTTDGIEVVNLDGTGRRKVTHSSAGRLTWSPDGTRIAYVGRGAEPYNGYDTDIYVTDVETGQETNITNNSARDDFPAWSPN